MILVTGATGFLGKRVCRKLEQSGRAFSRTSISLGADLRDFEQTLALFQEVRPKMVLNCASFAGGIQFGLKYPADIFRNNMPMIANLFEAAHRTGVERIVNPLANCVYPAHLMLFEESRFGTDPCMNRSTCMAFCENSPGQARGPTHLSMACRRSTLCFQTCTALMRHVRRGALARSRRPSNEVRRGKEKRCSRSYRFGERESRCVNGCSSMTEQRR